MNPDRHSRIPWTFWVAVICMTMKSFSKEELQKLCNDHWDYVEQVIRNEYDSETAQPNGSALDIDAYCRRIALHYKTALAHGFKHGVQWIEKQIILR